MNEVARDGLTRIVLVRHGQTSLNRGDRIRGRLDPPLDEEGLRQARLTAGYVASRWPVAAVYTSPLRRAAQTAEAIAQAQLLEAETFGGLLDLDFGTWHGLSFDEAHERYPSLHQAWREAPHTVVFPEGESLADVHTRALLGIHEIASTHRGHTVAMVGHAVVNRVILCTVLGISNALLWRFGQDTCAVNVFTVVQHGEMTLDLMNDSSHLAGASHAVYKESCPSASRPAANAVDND